MAKAKAFRVLIATDGSDHARAAIATAIHFPWPAETRVRVVAARKTRAEYRRSILLSALDRSAEAAACEFKPGKLWRSIRFPKTIDPATAKAEYRNGLLKLTAAIAGRERKKVPVTAA